MISWKNLRIAGELRIADPHPIRNAIGWGGANRTIRPTLTHSRRDGVADNVGGLSISCLIGMQVA
jgi:hypothetical protein